MSALLALTEPLFALTSGGYDIVLAAAGSEKLVDAIRNFVGPIFLLMIGLAALSFLYQRQITQFIQFLALAVGIAVLFYTPGVIQKVATFFSSAF